MIRRQYWLKLTKVIFVILTLILLATSAQILIANNILLWSIVLTREDQMWILVAIWGILGGLLKAFNALRQDYSTNSLWSYWVTPLVGMIYGVLISLFVSSILFGSVIATTLGNILFGMALSLMASLFHEQIAEFFIKFKNQD